MDRAVRQLCLVFLVSLLGVSSCQKNSGEGTRSRARDSSETNIAFVRFINAHLAGVPIALYFGGTKVFSEVSYKSVTAFKEVPAEHRDFILRDERNPSQNLPAISATLDAGKHYSVVAFDSDHSTPILRVITEEEEKPKSSKSRVRVIHAVPGAQLVTLYARGRTDKLASESIFGDVSPWNEVDPVDTGIEIRTRGDEDVLRIPNISMEAGRLYTLLVIGGPKTDRKLDAIWIGDSKRREKN
jgi:hypothetical protein